MNKNQTIIVNYIKKNGQITLNKAVQLTGANIHHNSHKWVGERLSRMVNSNLLRRVKPGVFELGSLS